MAVRRIRRGGSQTPRKLQESWRRTYAERGYTELPWFSRRPFPALREAVDAGQLRRGGKLLDIGCGAGTNAMFLAKSGFRVSGVDLAPRAIEAAQRRSSAAGLRLDLHVGDALRLPFPARTFDALTDVGCFHTIPVRLRRGYASEAERVLRPGGRFLLCWVAREYTSALGPPHRPSVEEIAGVFEKSFQFQSCEYAPAVRSGSIPCYSAVLERRRTRQPSRR